MQAKIVSIKKAKSYAWVLASIVILLLVSMRGKEHDRVGIIKPATSDTTKPPKQYCVSFTTDGWQQVINLLDASNYYVGRSLVIDSADKYKGYISVVRNELVRQVNLQLAADSTNKKSK